MENRSDGLRDWLQTVCEREGLSLRQVAVKVGVSHQTIAGLMNNKRALPQTIKKLAMAFGGDHNQRIALEDKLLVLAGHRTARPEEALSEPLARLLDKLAEFSESQLEIMEQFADYILKTERS